MSGFFIIFFKYYSSFQGPRESSTPAAEVKPEGAESTEVYVPGATEVVSDERDNCGG